MKNYIIIDKTELEERIKELRKVNNSAVNHIYSNMANELVNILSSGKDLQPVLEDSFDTGATRCYDLYKPSASKQFKDLDETKQDYINNFKL